MGQLLASGFIGCFEYAPWLRSTVHYIDRWRTEDAFVFAGGFGMALALVLALPLKWLNELEDAEPRTRLSWLWERCGLWLASLFCLYAALPWATASRMGLLAVPVGLTVAFVTRVTLVSEANRSLRRWGLARLLGGTAFLLGLGLFLHLLRGKNLFALHKSWKLLTLVTVILPLLPSYLAARRRYKKAVGKVRLTVSFVLMVLGILYQYCRGTPFDCLDTLAAALFFAWTVASGFEPDRVLEEKRHVPGWILLVPFASLAIAELCRSAIHRLEFIFLPADWIIYLTSFAVWHLALRVRADERTSSAQLTPGWLFGCRGITLAILALGLAEFGEASPVARIAAQLRSFPIIEEARNCSTKFAGVYTVSGESSFGILYLAPQHGFVRVKCGASWGCSAAFGRAVFSNQRIVLDHGSPNPEPLIPLSWRGGSYLIPSLSVPYVCEPFEKGEWFERPYEPIREWSMEPSQAGCRAPSVEPLRPILSNGHDSCILPEPIEAAPLAIWTNREGVARVTWPKGRRDRVVEKMLVISCRNGCAWRIESVMQSESILRPDRKDRKVTQNERFLALFPCASQKAEWEE